jgi:pimeloyl-ACP methyl ester carboxylesterase
MMRDLPNPMAAAARRRRSIWDSPEQMIGRLREGTPLRHWREDFLRAYVEHGTRPRDDGTIELKCPPDIEAQVYEMSGRHEAWERLADLGPPTLLLVGESSEMWGGDWREAAAALMPDGRVEVIADAGHFFPMERPDVTLERVLAFLT